MKVLETTPALIAEWLELKQRVAAVESVIKGERELRKSAHAEHFTKDDTVMLRDNNVVVTMTAATRKKLNSGIVTSDAWLKQLADYGGNKHDLFSFSASLRNPGYRSATPQVKQFIDEQITGEAVSVTAKLEHLAATQL